MTGKERVEAAIAMRVGDRPPVGAWGHTYKEEWAPQQLAAVTIERARRFGWDFVKFQPRASCFAEAFGSVYRPSGHRLKGPVLEKEAVADSDGWSTISLVNPKALDDQVEAIGIVARELGPDVPVIQTVFSPLTVAGYLVGKSKSRVLRDLRKRDDVRPVLDLIGDALVDFSRKSVDAGAAGIFYAISGYASKDALPEQQYRDLVLPTDLAVLNRLPKAGWFNVLHLCGSNLRFELSRDLPNTSVVSWSIHNQGNPSLAEGRKISGKAVMGGLGQRATLLYGPPPEVEAEARKAMGETGGYGLLIAPGCSVPPRARDANLAAMVSAIAA